ncbi:hypothetical protein [Limnobacter sp.]|uniref:hypothetical protein n=1 Tax=Limnobacter sp. TaxID=2003368 RepID=UPI002FE0E234
MSKSVPMPLKTPEVVANLWVCADEDGYVARLAGRTYVLDGTDREKLDLLKLLAATDFLSAEWMPIPENFGLIGPDGERLGYAQLSVLSDEYSKSLLVGPLLERLAATLPEQLHEIDGEYRQFRLEMPEAPLTVLTVVVERPDGQLVPMLNS